MSVTEPAQLQGRVPLPAPIPDGWFPRLATVLVDELPDAAVMLVQDEVMVVADMDVTDSDIPAAVDSFASVLAGAAGVLGTVWQVAVLDVEDEDAVDLSGVHLVDRMCELDVLATLSGWGEHAPAVMGSMLGFLDSGAILGRYAQMVAWTIGTLVDVDELTASDLVTWAGEASEDGEWQLLADSLASALLLTGLRDAFEEGERIDPFLVTSTLRALAVGVLAHTGNGDPSSARAVYETRY